MTRRAVATTERIGNRFQTAVQIFSDDVSTEAVEEHIMMLDSSHETVTWAKAVATCRNVPLDRLSHEIKPAPPPLK